MYLLIIQQNLQKRSTLVFETSCFLTKIEVLQQKPQLFLNHHKFAKPHSKIKTQPNNGSRTKNVPRINGSFISDMSS